jgi:hypothetical protein
VASSERLRIFDLREWNLENAPLIENNTHPLSNCAERAVGIIDTMAKVFISHSSRDQGFAEEFAAELRRYGHEPLGDLALRVSTDWDTQLQNALADSDFVVFLFTEQAIGSENILAEVGAAKALYNRFKTPRLIPVVIPGGVLPKPLSRYWAQQLPAVPTAEGLCALIDSLIRKSPPKARTEIQSKGLRILLWMTCSVLFALLPIAINYINGRANRRPPGWVGLLAGGELFLISAALAADAFGRALLGGRRFRILRVICGIGCALLLAVTSVYFGRIAFSIEEQRTALVAAVEARQPDLALQRLKDPVVDRSTVAGDSLWLFIFTGACALGVILVEED